MTKNNESVPEPGQCIPWDIKRQEFPMITGDEEQIKKIWQDVDGLGYMYIWQCLLSF